MAADPLSDNAAAVLALFDEEERRAFATEHDTPAGDPAGGHSASDLLRWILVRRTPFIQMASEIAALLGRIEGAIRGNIDFVIFPGEGEDLTLAFGPQVRKLVEIAGRWSQNGRYRDLTSQTRALLQSIRRLSEECRPHPIERDTAIGELLRTLPEWDPRRRAADRSRHPVFVDINYEYSPDDVRALETVDAPLSALVALAGRTEGLAESQRKILKIAGREFADTLSDARRKQSRRPPLAQPSIKRGRVARLLAGIAELHRSIELETELGGDAQRLVAAMALSFWKQRWRLYELWLFCHVCESLCRLSLSFDAAGRVANGCWTLKFTKDDRPVLRCQFADHRLDIYYQYHEQGADRANMPDIAVRIAPSSDWLLILDPKAGESFTRAALAEVCLRYADAFRPALSAVANYFPRDYRTEPLERLPPAILYHGLRPDSAGDLDAALRLALVRAGIVRLRVIILLDISQSTARLQNRLDQAIREGLARETGIDRDGSAIFLFAEEVAERIGVTDYLARGAPADASGGTDYAAAFQQALIALDGEPGGEIWLVSDGEDKVDTAEWMKKFRAKGIRLRALIAGPTIPPGIASLCKGAGGDWRLI